jgi:hypothetical protein
MRFHRRALKEVPVQMQQKFPNTIAGIRPAPALASPGVFPANR